MKVTIADYAGFCFGVERAIKLTEAAKNDYQNVVTFGPIIHNPQVVGDLEKAGVFVKNNPEDINDSMVAIVRTHGVEKQDLEKLSSRAGNVLDATCPYVKNAQKAAEDLATKGYVVVVVGEDHHPEVQGIISYVDGECYTVSTIEQARELPQRERYGVVAQTTQNERLFERIIDEIKQKSADVEVSHTICSATYKRQAAAQELAGEVDVMIVVGGRNSANTTRLASLASELCGRTYHVETVGELSEEMIEDAERIGITAGASTPNYIVNQVQEYILENGK